MNSEFFSAVSRMETFSEDGRASLHDLYATYLSLSEEYGWNLEIAYNQQFPTQYGTIELPILSFTSPAKGDSIYLLSGVHGEEPAGPNAIAKAVSILAEQGTYLPIILIPLCNPAGYVRDWRYFDEYRNRDTGNSIGDSEHHILNPLNQRVPKKYLPSSVYAEKFTEYLIQKSLQHQGILWIDIHEDTFLKDGGYIYTQGKKTDSDEVLELLSRLIQEGGLPLQQSGITSFGETVDKGIIYDIHDGAIEDLVFDRKIFYKGRIIEGPQIPKVYTLETPVEDFPLIIRVNTYVNILYNLPAIYKLAQSK